MKGFNSIGFGMIYKSTWTGQYTEMNAMGFANSYSYRVASENGILENITNLFEKVKKLFSI